MPIETFFFASTLKDKNDSCFRQTKIISYTTTSCTVKLAPSRTINNTNNSKMKVSFFVAAFNFVTVLVVVATTNPAVKSNKKLPSLSKPFQHPYDRRILDEDIDGCDESKCVSTGLWEHFNNSFTCYAHVGDLCW